VAENQVQETQPSGARYYYPDNKILTAEWSDPRVEKRWWQRWLPLAIVLAVVLGGAAAAWFLWLGPNRALNRATVMVMVDTNGDGAITPGDDAQGAGVIISDHGAPGYVLTSRQVLMTTDQSSCGNVEIWYRPGSDKCEKIAATVEAAGEEYGGEDELEKLARDWAVLKFTRPGKLLSMKNSDKTDFAEEASLKVGSFDPTRASTDDTGLPAQPVAGMLLKVDRNDAEGPIALTHNARVATGTVGAPVVMKGKLVGINCQAKSTADDSVTGEKVAEESLALPTYLLQESVFDRFQK